MPPNKSICALLVALVAIIYLNNASGQRYNIPGRTLNIKNNATWCTVSETEQNKCQAFSRAIDREISFFGANYVSLKCKQAFNKEECMTLLDQESVHLTTLDGGEVFVAGRYHSLIPIMQEIYDSGLNYQYAVAVVKKGSLRDVESISDLRGKKACFAGVGLLAGWVLPIEVLMRQGGMEIIDCNNHVKSTIKFFGPSCAVNSLIDKYNPLGDNSDQLCKLCVGKVPTGKCTNADPYAGYEGAFRCLVEAGDVAFLVHNVVQEMTSGNFDLNSVTKDQFELLCIDGQRRPIDDYKSCNWGTVPSRAVVTSSAINHDMRRLYQRFLDKAVKILGKSNNQSSTDNYNSNNNRYGFDNRQQGFEERNYNNNNNNNNNNNWDEFGRNSSGNYDGRGEFGRNFNENWNDYNNKSSTDNYEGRSGGGVFGRYNMNNWDNGTNDYYNRNRGLYDSTIPSVLPIENFHLFESAPRYGLQRNLIFSDSARDFVSLQEKDQTYQGYLGRSLDPILAVRRCPVQKMTLCVTSDVEMDKCIRMKIALTAQLLKPDLNCYKGHSHIHCMQAINSGTADVAVLDASDVYTAGLRFNLIPFMSEVYNLGSPDYYVVAVAKEEDDNTDLTYLKNKNTCHPGINTAAGWIYPLAYLISNGWIRGYGCDSVRAAAEYFSKSCVPGALSTEYNIGVPYDNMCDLCHGPSYRYCRRDASEDYYGHSGALRCLIEGGGDVAFVKHTTVAEVADGKRRDFWARNSFVKDFELLCPDGTRRRTTDYLNCNLGRVAANAIVTRGGDGYNEDQISAYANLFAYAQQFYGRKDTDEFTFSMFTSAPPNSDLIFQDATQHLYIIPRDEREFSRYLGQDFMRARRIVDCAAGAASIKNSVVFTGVTLVFTYFLTR